MVKVITAEKRIDCEHLLGQYLDESHYDLLIEEDCDFYAPNNSLTEGNGEHNIAFKFRKNVYTPEEQSGAYIGLIKAAIQNDNRGLASGPKTVQCRDREWVTDWQHEVLDAILYPSVRLDDSDPVQELVNNRASFKEEPSTRAYVWKKNKIEAIYPEEEYSGFFDRWIERILPMSKEERLAEAKKAIQCVSTTDYAAIANSGIAGFFDRYPRFPYGRACAYNVNHPELFELAYPYFHKLDKFFRELLPNRYAAQKKCADAIDQRFVIPGTVFTTITVNKNFRTAAHRDAGDLAEGFSNLGVVTNGKDFRGGYLVLPEYRVAINIRPGDQLLIANHTAIHGNTEITAPDGCCMECVERMSVVCYFREKMLNLGSWDYECARRDFIEERRLNKDHPLQRPRWNGVSPNMFESDEWLSFIKDKKDFDGRPMIEKYHNDAFKKKRTLEEYFL